MHSFRPFQHTDDDMLTQTAWMLYGKNYNFNWLYLVSFSFDVELSNDGLNAA